MNVYEDKKAEEIMRKAYNDIVYGDNEAVGLHNSAQFAEHFDSKSIYKAWNDFYDRIEYLEDICEYVGIKVD